MERVSVPPWLGIVAVQGIAGASMWLIDENLVQLAEARWLLQGLIASLLGRLMGLPYWLVPINLLLPLAVGYLAPTTITS